MSLIQLVFAQVREIIAMKGTVGILCLSIVLVGAVALTNAVNEGYERNEQSNPQDSALSCFVERPDSSVRSAGNEVIHSRASPARVHVTLSSKAGPKTVIAPVERRPSESEVNDTPRFLLPKAPSVNFVEAFGLGNQRCRVETDLTGEESRPRADLLAMYARTSAASGRFDLAVTACAMFLDEFGTEHPYSSRIAMRLADDLAPLDLDSIEIIHTEHGPRFQPQGRMGNTVSSGSLQHAIAAYRVAADLTEDVSGKGRALLRIGWVYRALDNWPAATKAWEGCAAEAAGTRWAADALWLSAENLRWANQPAVAAERLRRLAHEYPEDARTPGVPDRIERLEADASRSPDWLLTPVASLQAEIEARAGVRTPSEVYRSVVRWLQRRGKRTALQAVARWACGQSDWPLHAQIRCRYDLIDLLAAGTDESKWREAAEWLSETVDLAPTDAEAVAAAIRRHRLLNKLGQFGEADRTLDEIGARVRGVRCWEPVVLTVRIESLLNRGEEGRAREVLDTLIESYPDHNVAERFGAAFPTMRKEGSR